MTAMTNQCVLDLILNFKLTIEVSVFWTLGGDMTGMTNQSVIKEL